MAAAVRDALLRSDHGSRHILGEECCKARRYFLPAVRRPTYHWVHTHTYSRTYLSYIPIANTALMIVEP